MSRFKVISEKFSKILASPRDSVIFLCAAVMLSASCLLYILAEPVQPKGGWRNYRILLVEDRVSPEEVHTLLESEEIRGVIGQNNARVSYSGIDRMHSVTVSDLYGTLDSRDPRWDPYLRSIPGYFHTVFSDVSYNIFYIPDRYRNLTGKVSVALTGLNVKWDLPENEDLFRILLTAAPLLWIGALILRIRKNWILYTLAACLLLPLLLQGTTASFLGGCLLFFAWSLLMEAGIPCLESFFSYGNAPKHPGTVRLRGLFAVLTVIGVFSIGLLLSFPVLYYFGALAGLIGLAGIFYLFKKWNRMRSEHSVFFPAPILPKSFKDAFAGKIGSISVWLLIGLLCPVFILSINVAGGGPAVPTPQIEGSRDLTWDGLFRLWNRERPANRLPDLADYLAHRAYQEGFVYNAQYRFPLPGEGYPVTTFRREGNRFLKSSQLMEKFTSQWFKQKLITIDEFSIPAMLIGLDTPAGVVLKPAGGVYLPGIIPVYTAVIIFVLFIPILTANIHLTAYFIDGLKNGVSRRSRQEV
jgi:hypothetical protein